MNSTGTTKVRAAVRYPLSLEALVMPMTSAAEGQEMVPVRTRDMSSRGISFYTGRNWGCGETVSLQIKFGRDVLEPYSYTLEVEGQVVRKGTDPESGMAYHAVQFDGPGKILHWREHSRLN